MMGYGQSFYSSGGGIPAQITTDMNAVLNKKFGTSGQSYPADEWADNVNLMGLLPEKTVSGSVASFADGADDVPIKTATFDIAPTLDGVSAVNVVRTGANIWQLDETCIGENFDGYANVKRYSQTIKMPLGTYTFSCNGSISSFSSVAVGISKKPIGNTLNLNNDTQRNSIAPNTPRTYTITSEYPYLFILGIADGDTMTKAIMEELSLMINVGSSVSTYEPYSATTRTISLGQTVYGGSVTVDEEGECELNEADTEQVLRATMFPSWSSTINGAYGPLPSGWSEWLKKDGGSALAFSHGQATSRREIVNVTDGIVIGDTYNGNESFIILKLSGCNSSAEVQAAIETAYSSGTPMKVVYELATPTTSTLTPITPITSALGVNNIWCDTGDVETLTYRQSSALPTEQVLTDGQVSTLSDYATANYTKSVDGFEMITIRLKDTVNGVYYEDIQTFKVSSIGSGISVNFTLHTTVTVSVTKTSISGYSYGGAWQNIYADVVAFSDSIFDN